MSSKWENNSGSDTEAANCISPYSDPLDRDNGLTMETFYEYNKGVPVGRKIFCPCCSEIFTKRSYQHSFCSNKGKGNCKDRYWNTLNPRGAKAKWEG